MDTSFFFPEKRLFQECLGAVTLIHFGVRDSERERGLRSISTSKDCSSGRPRSELDAEQLNVMGQSDRFSGGRRRVLRILSGSLVSIWPVTVTRLRRQVMTGMGKPEGGKKESTDYFKRNETSNHATTKIELKEFGYITTKLQLDLWNLKVQSIPFLLEIVRGSVRTFSQSQQPIKTVEVRRT